MMQIELKMLQRKLGITFIYVTHDQDEALSMSDRIVVLRNGKIEQIDNPNDIYDDVSVSVSFKKDEIENPETGDSIVGYMLSIISLIIMLIFAIKFLGNKGPKFE